MVSSQSEFDFLIITLFFIFIDRFDGAGYSLAGTRAVLSSLASDCMADQGFCLNAVEVFWTPSERDEAITKRDVILDFPELIDL